MLRELFQDRPGISFVRSIGEFLRVRQLRQSREQTIEDRQPGPFGELADAAGARGGRAGAILTAFLPDNAIDEASARIRQRVKLLLLELAFNSGTCLVISFRQTEHFAKRACELRGVLILLVERVNLFELLQLVAQARNEFPHFGKGVVQLLAGGGQIVGGGGRLFGLLAHAEQSFVCVGGSVRLKSNERFGLGDRLTEIFKSWCAVLG
ncbi:hypothetical protein LVY75_33110 (plasmid) [Sinorhizobium sp. B11]